MQLSPPSRHRFIPSRSRASLTVYAPGHNLRAEGIGIEGTVELEGDRLVRASATFRLDALSTGDRLANHEMKKFLGSDHGLPARAEIQGPLAVPGEGSLAFSIGKRSMQAKIALSGTPEDARGKFALTFTGLGYSPPKLLFLRVKDTIDIEISAQLEPVA